VRPGRGTGGIVIHPDRRKARQDHPADDRCAAIHAPPPEHRYEGEELTGLTTAEIMRKDIAIVPEAAGCFSRLTVRKKDLSSGGDLQLKGLISSSPAR